MPHLATPQAKCYRREGGLTRVTVHEYALRGSPATLAPRYATARRGEKRRILDEFCRTTGMHRKATIRAADLGEAARKAVEAASRAS